MQLESFVEVIEAARKSLARVIEQVPREKWEQAGPNGPWSLKDILAHIAWHEEGMIEICEKKDVVGSFWWTLPMQERNDNVYNQYKDTPLEDVLEFFETSHRRFLTALQSLTDDDLNDPTHFHDMPTDWLPWRMLANNTYEHYLRHMGQVVAIRRAANAG